MSPKRQSEPSQWSLFSLMWPRLTSPIAPVSRSEFKRFIGFLLSAGLILTASAVIYLSVSLGGNQSTVDSMTVFLLILGAGIAFLAIGIREARYYLQYRRDLSAGVIKAGRSRIDGMRLRILPKLVMVVLACAFTVLLVLQIKSVVLKTAPLYSLYPVAFIMLVLTVIRCIDWYRLVQYRKRQASRQRGKK